MNTISEIATSALISADSADKTESSTLGQDEFMKLMLTQMQHQDPFKPTGNTEFIAQMAQFSSVTGIDAMRTTLDKFVADQASAKMLDAANLVGRTAMIASNEVELNTESPVVIEYTLPDSTQTTTAMISDQTGELVHRIDLGAKDRGTHLIEWDGNTTDKGKAAPGMYTVSVEYPGTEGESVAAPLSVATTVKSVNLGTNATNLTLSTGDGREMNITDVRKFL